LFVNPVINPPESKPQSSSRHEGLTVFPEREFNECLRTLQRLNPILDRRANELKSSCMAYAGCLRSVWTYELADLRGVQTRAQLMQLATRERGFQQRAKDDLDQARSQLLMALRKLDTDGSLMSERVKK
jgi:hypothetical protein